MTFCPARMGPPVWPRCCHRRARDHLVRLTVSGRLPLAERAALEADLAARAPEFGWLVKHIRMENCTAQSEYFMMRSEDLSFSDVRFQGKYSFQYIENAVFENCSFDTKDAFWHAKNVTVKNSVVKGEAYECGVPTIGKTWVQFNVGYYLFALIFLIFDVELVFLYPWAVVAKSVGWLALVEIIIFMFILFIGFLYAHKKGALKWM